MLETKAGVYDQREPAWYRARQALTDMLADRIGMQCKCPAQTVLHRVFVCDSNVNHLYMTFSRASIMGQHVQQGQHVLPRVLPRL